MSAIQWDDLVEKIGPRLYRYFKYKGAGLSASDLTQETFLRLIENKHRFNPKQGPIIAYALGFAQNIWRENNRKNQATENLDEQTIIDDFNLFEKIEQLDQNEKIKLIISHLPQIQQDILFFYFDEEITTREISDILAIPEGTVKSHLHRSKELIKTILMKENI